MKKEFLEILMKKDHFPCKLDKKDGELLKKLFKKDIKFQMDSLNTKKIDDLEFRYTYEEEGIKYILLEEYIFKEGETFLSLENSIGVDYYFNKI
ncbi:MULTISPECIES: hypothetical protein [Psychrilyobacter]|uniref:Uncharacterized protein n=1 Tax=Psychrilyobacter piezotolerans TaxID=2293438 RepID=A0ABX9KK99_9FUSO|nr:MULTISPECIES: hypothetical protein [Psychrilyobacter]MCS5420556.1 hypothetical protein [Psychrilyobacter sp. S5]NDI76648.1 hypothetical protein [Psychrilyobacter piezotolerans]RDE65274.1 hypothetical protein DV867_01725 [Psychrilyobacter sp. S5]REI42892.1 hypothetical protein DYH56_01725 [Psychrilyobacter piezotolerans]